MEEEFIKDLKIFFAYEAQKRFQFAGISESEKEITLTTGKDKTIIVKIKLAD